MNLAEETLYPRDFIFPEFYNEKKTCVLQAGYLCKKPVNEIDLPAVFVHWQRNLYRNQFLNSAMKLRGKNESHAWMIYREGDDRMFSAIYREFSKPLYHYGLKFTRNTALIEDCIQDLFAELYKNRKTVGQTDNILRYLLKSFRRKLFRQLSKEKRYDLKDEQADYCFEAVYSIEHEIILRDQNDRQTEIFRNALKELTPRQNEAIYLKFTKGLDYEEVAEIMEMGLESCRNLIYRAVKVLRESIQGKNLPENKSGE